MKKTLIQCCLFALCIVFASCSTSVTLYKTNMLSMQIEEDNNIKTFATDTMCYQDSLLKLCISLESDKRHLIVDFENLQDYKMKILWDEAVIIVNGYPSAVIHGGTKYIDKNKTQLPTIIIGKTNYREYISPSDNVYWAEATRYTSGYWAIRPIINGSSDNLVVSIPIEYQGKQITYTSKFITKEAGKEKVPNVMGTTFLITGGIIGVLVGIIFILF